MCMLHGRASQVSLTFEIDYILVSFPHLNSSRLTTFFYVKQVLATKNNHLLKFLANNICVDFFIIIIFILLIEGFHL